MADEKDLSDQLRDAPVVPIREGVTPGQGGQGGDQAPPQDGPDGPSKGGRRRGEIYDGCPVVPLGVRGDYAYFLDANGQQRAAKKIERGVVLSLFGHAGRELYQHFPIWQKFVREDGKEGWRRSDKKFDTSKSEETMYQAASECGVFDPDNTVRGVGAWTDDDGGLILHLGDRLLIGGEEVRPGKHGGYIYPAQPALPMPDFSPRAPDPVPEIMDVLQTWKWMQPDLHPFLALGLIGVQMLCGALDWRPVFWLTAPADSGKSRFQDLIELLHGPGALVKSADATKAGITSQLGQSSLPVAMDELEPGDERSKKETDIVVLARVAASGGEIFRGSADQTGVRSKVYSAFLFSSIIIPGVMKPQDVQRLIRLDMNALGPKRAKLDMSPRTWRARGARLKARLIERWPGWNDRLAAWRHTLEMNDVTGRDADNWATVLAMADMGMSESVADEDTRTGWARKAALAVANDREDTVNDAEAMLLHLMSQTFDPWRRGQQFTIAQWVMAAGGLEGAPSSLKFSLGEEGTMGVDVDHARRKKANVLLAQLGLRVRTEPHSDLFIANAQLQALKDLFQGSDWAGGAWKQSAARVPGATKSKTSLKLAGIGSRGIFIPLKSIPGLMGLPMDRDRPETDSSQPPDMEDFV